MERIKLYNHQKKALRLTMSNPYYALFMEQGTGKTPVAIKAIEQRFLNGEIDKVIIFAPSSVVFNWVDELGRFLSLKRSQYYIATLDDKRKNKRVEAYKKLMSQDVSSLTVKQLRAQGLKGTKSQMLKQFPRKLLILVVNYEKARVMYQELYKFNAQFMVWDESQRLKNRGAQQSKKIYKMSRRVPYRLLMSGTPISNGLEDIFMQYKIMDEEILGGDYKEFEGEYMVKGGYMGYQILDYKNENQLNKIIKSTSFRVLKRDCLDLPKVTNQYLYCELGPKSRKAYNSLNREMMAELNIIKKDIDRKQLKGLCREHSIPYNPRESYYELFLRVSDYINTSSVELAITKSLRLQQICGGFLTMDSGEVIPIGNEKANLVKEFIQDYDRPVVIFCKYVAEMKYLHEMFQKMKRGKHPITSEILMGKTKDRGGLVRGFQKGTIDVLIVQIKTGGVGINLTAADTSIFYSWGFSYEDYDQARARIDRSGQKNPMTMIHLLCKDTVDKDILEAVKAKGRLAKKILD